MTKPTIGMIGKGSVGSALAAGAQRCGYEVRTVGRDPEGVQETAAWADLIVLAVPYGERANAVRTMEGAYRDKVLVDVSNALTPSYGFAHDLSTSGAEELQAMADGAAVVKAFNTVFAENMATGRVGDERLTLLVAGDDAEAKAKVLAFGEDLGFDGVDAGPLENARWLEALGYLNIRLGYGLEMGTAIGFKLVRP